VPSGIATEIYIAIGVLVLIALIAFVGRRRKPPREEVDTRAAPTPPAGSGTTATEAEATPTTTEAPTGLAPPPVGVPPVAVPPEERVEPSRRTLRERLSKSRRFLSDRLADAFGRAPDDETWEDVEAALIQADIGVEAATKITDDLRAKARDRKITTAEEVRGLLAEELVSLFDIEIDRGLTFAAQRPTVWIVLGVNGTGKTTTIGKLAADLRGHGRKVSLAAADTFRAAADEQLQVWADRAGAEVVKHQPGADPGAVAYDALQHARARDVDVLIVDTAGRLHTKTPLMDELGKIRRVIEKEGKVTEALLVIDATAGQNGLVQAREFAEAAGVTGIVLTKLDGTAKGGIALAIERSLGIPIKLVGVGEGLQDLEPFDPKTFVDALLS
jgi:fused signal recognition particle receptor